MIINECECDDKEFVNKIINQVARNRVNIITPPKRLFHPLINGSFADIEKNEK